MSAHSRRRYVLKRSYSHTEPIVQHDRDPQTGRVIGAKVVGRIDRQGDGSIIEVRTLKKTESVNPHDHRR